MVNRTITLREVLISILIVLGMVAIGLFISTSIHNKVSEKSEEYFKALKIDNDKQVFKHSLKTNVGNALTYGKFVANEPVTNDAIKGEYFRITEIEEHYVMKTRTVTYTDSNGRTQTRIETYWEWEEYDRDTKQTKTFTFLGENFNVSKVKFNNSDYHSTITNGHVRYIYYTIPKEFKGTLFAKLDKNTINNTELYAGSTLKDVIEKREKSAVHAVVIFWVIWIIVIGLIITLFIIAENKFINNH